MLASPTIVWTQETKLRRNKAEVGTDNPLAVLITSGNRVILPEPPTTPEDAMRLVERFVGQAAVRVGVTRYPAGHGIADVTELDPTMLDACANIGLGSALFGKVYRIVAHAQGGADNAAFQQAVAAWNTGMFEGRYVFGEPDPGPLPIGTDVRSPKHRRRIQAEATIP